jgi:hypothetical protein
MILWRPAPAGLVCHIGGHIVFLLTRVRPVLAFDPNLLPLGALVQDVPTLRGTPRGVRGTYVWGTRL